MATKLKNMKLNSVDLVKQGANPKAHFRILKSAEGGETKDMSFINTLKKGLNRVLGITPSDEKLSELAKSIGQDPYAVMEEALKKSAVSILKDEDLSGEEKQSMLETSIEQFCKALKDEKDDSDPEDVDDESEEDEKDPEDLDDEDMEKKCETKKGKEGSSIFSNLVSQSKLRGVSDEIWTISSVFNDSLRKILEDTEMDSDTKGTEMEKSTNEYIKLLQSAVPKWANGETAKILKEKKEEGEETLVEIDITKMSDEDRPIAEKLIAKYAKGTGTEDKPSEIHPDVKKALDELTEYRTKASAEVAELKKQLEMKDLVQVAKKYEILGKKPEELAEKLYELKKAGDSIYNEYTSILDEALNVTETSDLFKELGTSRSGGGAGLNEIVKELQKADPALTHEKAVAKAFEQHPELDPFTGELRK